MLVVLCLALAAALAIKMPGLFGMPLGEVNGPFYVHNASLFVLPLLTGYFAWKRGLDAATMRVAGAWPSWSLPCSPMCIPSRLPAATLGAGRATPADRAVVRGWCRLRRRAMVHQ